MTTHPESQRFARRCAAWVTGVVVLAGLLAAFHVSDFERFVALARGANPAWFGVALLLQASTYGTAAAVWQRGGGCSGTPTRAPIAHSPWRRKVVHRPSVSERRSQRYGAAGTRSYAARYPGARGSGGVARYARVVLLGVPVEVTVAATLLFRGVSFWLPMVPGVWLARAELQAARAPTR
jgi:hypothetical protein